MKEGWADDERYVVVAAVPDASVCDACDGRAGEEEQVWVCGEYGVG